MTNERDARGEISEDDRNLSSLIKKRQTSEVTHNK